MEVLTCVFLKVLTFNMQCQKCGGGTSQTSPRNNVGQLRTTVADQAWACFKVEASF